MIDRFEKLRPFLVPLVLLFIVIVDTVMVFLSEGTHGGADDVSHYHLARYAFQNPKFFLNLWGKPFFTALMAPFAQLGFHGVRIFNVLAGTATAYFTYRTAKLFNISTPIIAIFLLISSPLYTVLMISGMTEILFSLVLILSIFLFFRKNYIWSAILLSFIPFVRTEGAVIIPLFMIALAWERQWRALPFLMFGFVFYSIAGSFYHDDILWIIHKMPYSGNAKDIYGSGELLHYLHASKYIFGLPLAMLLALGLVAWLTEPLVKKEGVKKAWLMQMLVGYLPFFTYFVAHSYVWWKGMGNSVGMIRVIVAVLPSAVLLASLGWSRILDLMPVQRTIKYVGTGIMALLLAAIPYTIYRIPVPLEGTQAIVKDASDWMLQSEYSGAKTYYFNPFFPHFLNTNPYDSNQNAWFIPDREHPENSVKVGEIVIWDAHFGPNEGRMPLGNLMNNTGFKLVHLTREHEPFIVLGGYTYEIYFFQRIPTEEAVDNHKIYEAMVEEILAMGLEPKQSSDNQY